MRNVKSKKISQELSDYQHSDAKEKNKVLVGYSSTSAVFPIEILKEKIKLVVAEK